MANVMPKIRLDGMDDLIRKLRKLEKRTANTIARKALRAGTTPIFKAAKENLRQVQSREARGQLLWAMTRIIKTYRNTGISVAVVGPDFKDGRHGHLIEFGTGPRWQKKGPQGQSNWYVGFVSPTPFLRPAFDRHGRGAAEKIRIVLEQEIFKANWF